MASKNADNSVNERRLRPIYDWLDNGNNKKALQEADKILKRQPNLLCVKVLKALALVRLGRVEEADVILREVQKAEPDDDLTLQAMAICYRETHQPEMACQMYEAALRKDPLNEEYGSHLFMAYVRVGDYRKQQQAAVNLFKAKPKNPYYFWAVMSIAMQASESSDATARNVALTLAERMVKKFISENKIEAEAEVIMHLMILELQEKYAEALEVLRGPLAQKLPQNTINIKTGNYLMKQGLWEETAAFFEQLLRENPDHWTNYVHYFDAVFHSDVRDENVERARSFVFSLADAETAKEKNRLRGPFLAQIHLIQTLKEKGITGPWLDKLHGLYENYVAFFGDKPCCFKDLKPFLDKLPQDKWAGFLEFVKNSAQLDQGSSPQDVNQLSRHLLSFQCDRFLKHDETLSTEEKISLARLLWHHYVVTLNLNEKLLPTDIRLNDVYVLLAAHLLLDVFVTSNGDRSLLLECLALLETARAHSPANFHIKLLITRVYTVAGYGRAAQKHYESLDIKYIQLDTVGHFLSRPLVSLGCPQEASPLLCSALKFYTSHARETSECLISAYKFGSFEKIPEFTKLRHRLNNSLNFAISTVERMFIDLIYESTSYAKLAQAASGMTADPEKDQPNWSSLVDNRDTSLLISWDPAEKQVSPALIEKTFTAEVDFARLRNRLLHAFVAAVALPSEEQHSSPASNGAANGVDSHPKGVWLEKLLSELQQLQQEYVGKWQTDYSQYDLFTPQIPRIHSYASSRCVEPLVHLMQFALQIRCSSAEGGLSADFPGTLDRLLTNAENVDVKNTLWKAYLTVEHIYNAVETVAFCTMILCSIHAMLLPKKALSKKKKKRDSKDTASDVLFDQYSNARSSLKSVLERLEKLLDALDTEILLESLKLDTRDYSSTEALKNLGQPRSSEMKAILQEKMKLLASCSL